MSEPPKTKSTQKLVLVGIAILFIAIVAVIVGIFIQAGMAIWFIICAFVAGVTALIMYFFYKIMPQQLVDVEKAAFMDIFESTFMSNLPMPQSLVTARNDNATIQCHPGEIYGMTSLPVDETFFELVGEPKELKKIVIQKTKKGKKIVTEKKEIMVPNRVWAFRMKLAHKLFKGANYIAVICDNQISDLSRDASGHIQFSTTILAHGHWAKYGLFYLLFNSANDIASEQAAIDTIKTFVALRQQTKRLAEATSANAQTKQELIDMREARKRELEVSKH